MLSSRTGIVDNTRSFEKTYIVSLSNWSRSSRKRVFDCACVLMAMPLLIPLYILVAVVVYITSPGPVFFIQKRVGRDGVLFPIFKFRTMESNPRQKNSTVTTKNNQKFTRIGPLLRRYKLDEMPQFLNVLAGHMSLVGPRPKVQEHCICPEVLACRPGVTGAATVAFAREEMGLAHVPTHKLVDYYQTVVLPQKAQLDMDYMVHATIYSDTVLIFRTLLRRWDDSVWDEMPKCYHMREESVS